MSATEKSAKSGIGVIGAGPWGLALAAAAARTGSPVLVHSRRKLDALPKGVSQARDMQEIGKSARLVIIAVPSKSARTVARELGDVVDGHHYLIHGTRGLAGDGTSSASPDEDLSTITEVLRAETPVRRLGALGGPALPEDLAAGRPSVMVCGSAYPEVNEAVQEAFVTPALRLYSTDDLRGLEWASALVGCLIIGVGYAQALGVSAGLIAALISRGVQEAGKIASAAGGEERTLLGLAGYGDLLASVEQQARPEILLGKALAKGRSLPEAIEEAKLRVEAVELIPRVLSWTKRHHVSAPIFTALANGVLSSRPSEAIVHDLMTAPIEDRG